jgi:outer membrane protein assembly factor BamA
MCKKRYIQILFFVLAAAGMSFSGVLVLDDSIKTKTGSRVSSGENTVPGDSIIKPSTVPLRFVHWHGNKHLSQTELREITGLRPRAAVPAGWPDVPFKTLSDRYTADGFVFARVDSFRLVDADLDVWIFEGSPLKVGAVDLEGLDPAEARLISDEAGLEPGDAFQESALGQKVEDVLDVMENRGYPLATVNLSRLDVDTTGREPHVAIGMRVDRGPEVSIGLINASGNTLTKQTVIRRETRLGKGTLFRARDLVTARESLQRLGYFTEVGEPVVTFRSDTADVTFPVKETSSNFFDGVVGYAPPRNDRERGTVTGRLEFAFLNLFGTGRRLDAFWEKKEERTQNVRFGYEEPWIFGYPVFPGFKFSQEIRDTLYVDRSFLGSVRVSPWPAFWAKVEGGRREVLPDSLASASFAVAKSSTWFVSGSFEVNTLDDVLNPRHGMRYATSAMIGRKRNLGPEFLMTEGGLPASTTAKRLEVDAEVLAPTLRRQAAYVAVHGREVSTGEPFVPAADQVRFGGALTVRGYLEDAFRGSSAAWFNLEYRYLFGPRSRAFVFLDGGAYQRLEPEIGRIKGFKLGYGIGVRVETGLGIIGVDYGLGEGDGFGRGKVHVGLRNRF